MTRPLRTVLLGLAVLLPATWPAAQPGAGASLAPCPPPCVESLGPDPSCLPRLAPEAPAATACAVVGQVYAAAARGDHAAIASVLDDHVTAHGGDAPLFGRAAVAAHLLAITHPTTLTVAAQGRVVATEAPPGGPPVRTEWRVIDGVVVSVRRAAEAPAPSAARSH
ncbi:hypothetical protein [Rubrivirga sp. IMCC45206]|uniref:hypothetical protein n=1 Tax=Rubrivirga sp. IMCC45206 TaxID=3391614 RepID=UPI00398FBAE0